MKRKISIAIAVMLTAMLYPSCDKDGKDDRSRIPVRDCRFSLALNFSPELPAKSADGYTEPQDYEVKVNSVQIFIFNASGKLEEYYNAGTETSGIYVSTTSGEKSIWAIANGPDLSSEPGISDINGFCSHTIDLGENNTAPDRGFIMSGCKKLTVTPSTQPVSIPVRRLASRIALQKITNNLPSIYGAVTIDNVFLANVAGNQDLSGSAFPSTWYNKAGRCDDATESTMIINGTSCPASCPDLTFREVSHEIQSGESYAPDIPSLLYCYPNTTSADDTGWFTPFTERKTRIVITATIAGIVHYYPVTIGHLERNTAYSVEVNISGPGSTDPDIPVIRESASFCVEIQGWESGASYEEII